MAKPSAGMTALERLTRVLVSIPRKEIEEKMGQYTRKKSKRKARPRVK
jgi:hypothetical protein